MTKKQLTAKIKAADKAAQKAVKKCVSSNMSDKQKAEAIHNYIVNSCQYARACLKNHFRDLHSPLCG